MWWEEKKQWSQMSQERKSEGKDVGWKDDKENRKKSGARGRPAFPSLHFAAGNFLGLVLMLSCAKLETVAGV